MGALAAALLVFGATQLRDLPVDTLPEFTPTTVEIQTEALGLSAAEVEQLITVPLEQDLLLIQAHALPQVSKPPQMLQPLSSTSRVMMIGLSSQELSPIELSVLAR